MLCDAELGLEGAEPGVVQLGFSPLYQLPGPGVVRPFLDREVYVALWDPGFAFVVEDRLEGGYDL